jgi:hypothetical protein
MDPSSPAPTPTTEGLSSLTTTNNNDNNIASRGKTNDPPDTNMPSPIPSSVPEQSLGIVPVAAPKSYVAPAPGVKDVREAYKGKGWAPPQKEWEATEKRKGDKTRIEVEDEWDEDGNLRRTTIKHITTPDWKVKKEKTIEIIPAEEAEKMGLGRKS